MLTALASEGQIKWTDSATGDQYGYPISDLFWSYFEVDTAFRVAVLDKRDNSTIISWSNITGASDNGNTLNGQSTLSAILAEVKIAFNVVPGGSGGATHVIVDSSALPTGAATEATLAAILAALLPTAAATIASTIANASGNVSAGKKAVSFVTSSDFSGTINGIARAASSSFTIALPNGQPLPAIAYVITTGTITIDTAV